MESGPVKTEKSPTMIMQILFYTGIMKQPVEKKLSDVVLEGEPAREEIAAAVELQYEEAKAVNVNSGIVSSLFSWLSSWSRPAVDDRPWPPAEMAPEIAHQQKRKL